MAAGFKSVEPRGVSPEAFVFLNDELRASKLSPTVATRNCGGFRRFTVGNCEMASHDAKKTPTHKGRQGQIEKPLSCCQLAAFLTAGIRSLLSSIRSMRMSVIEGANHGFSLVKSLTAKTHETASTSEPLPK